MGLAEEDGFVVGESSAAPSYEVRITLTIRCLRAPVFPVLSFGGR